MCNITLIGTHHRQIGKCNAAELYKIVESITPDVIFIELPPDLYDIISKDERFNHVTPEVKAIKRYLLDYNVACIPVDIEPDQNLLKEMDKIFKAFNRYSIYKKLEDEQYKMTHETGYAFLNSKNCMNLDEEKKIIEKNLIELMVNKDRIFRIWNLFYDEKEKREKEMLKNIYGYSKENNYDRAVFITGSGHRKSLMQKIQEYEKNEEIKINWTFYNGDN